MSGANLMTFEGCNYFRQRLILATLSGKTVRIKKIRSKEDDPGLKGVYRPIIIFVVHVHVNFSFLSLYLYINDCNCVNFEIYMFLTYNNFH